MNRNRLFIASCIALVTTSMFFSIRGDAADALAADFQLDKEQLGFIFQPAFYGFTLSILIGGSLVDLFGMRRLLTMSGIFYILAILAIVFVPFPDGPIGSIFGNPITLTLWFAMLALGVAQGLVEGVINPLCSTLYPEEKTHRMNVLHAWWPGGLIVGGLLAYLVTVVMGLGRVSQRGNSNAWLAHQVDDHPGRCARIPAPDSGGRSSRPASGSLPV